MLPFAEHKLRHMRRHKVPMDAYKDDDYRIVIKHDQFSGIDLIDIEYEAGGLFYVGVIRAKTGWTEPEDNRLAVTDYYFVNLGKKTKKFVYRATIETDETFARVWRSMNSYYDKFVSVDPNWEQSAGGDKGTHVFHGNMIVRAIGLINMNDLVLTNTDIPYEQYLNAGNVNLKAPYTVDQTPIPFDPLIIPPEPPYWNEQNTNYVKIGYGRVENNRIWGVARTAKYHTPQDWEGPHDCGAYIVYRDVDALTDPEDSESAPERHWTVHATIAEWVDQEDGTFDEFAVPRRTAPMADQSFVRQQPMWNATSVYLYGQTRTAVEEPTPPPDYNHTHDLTIYRHFRETQITTKELVWAEGSPIWFHAFLQDHTEDGELLGYVAIDHTTSVSRKIVNYYVGYEEDIKDVGGTNDLALRGFAPAQERGPIFSYNLNGLSFTPTYISPTDFWVIKTDVKVTEENGLENDSKYGFMIWAQSSTGHVYFVVATFSEQDGIEKFFEQTYAATFISALIRRQAYGDTVWIDTPTVQLQNDWTGYVSQYLFLNGKKAVLFSDLKDKTKEEDQPPAVPFGPATISHNEGETSSFGALYPVGGGVINGGYHGSGF